MGLLDDAIREHLELKRRRGADPTEVEREEREVLGPMRSRAVADELQLDDPHAEEESEHEPREGVSWANGGSEHHPGEVRPGAGAFDHEELSEPIRDSGLEREPRPYPPATYEPEPYPPARHEPEAYPAPGHAPEAYPAPGHAPEPYPAAGHATEPEPYRAGGHAPEPDPYPDAVPPYDPEPHPGARHAPEPEPSLAYKPPDEDPTTVEYKIEDADEEEQHPHPESEKEDVLEETPDFLQDTPDHDRLWFEQRPPRDFDFDG